MTQSPILMWFRRDLRLADHAALTAACATGRPVIPVFICDDLLGGVGAAAKMRLGASVDDFAQLLAGRGSRLILRQGDALTVLRELIAQTGAGAIYWSRLYDPQHKARDTGIKAALTDDGITVKSFAGHILFEPWTVDTKAGGYYKVFTPMWKAVRDRDVGPCLPAPDRIPTPTTWPQSDNLSDWRLDADMRRGADVLQRHFCVGETAALDRLSQFIDEKIDDYALHRNIPGSDATSRLSENLTYGEISPRQCWHAGWRALHDGAGGAETFLRELVWREFAYHLAHHTPQLLTENWKPGWDDFPWNTADTPEVIAWKQGRTGIPFVDAAMREMYVTGTMHNRARMIVASYLTKHLLTHWKVGMDWFADCLIDWDPCSNAMGWQWVAGTGPDAAPYFRVFNAVTQREKFDPQSIYVDHWIAETTKTPTPDACSYFEMVPLHWKLSADATYPNPVVSMAEGRARALAAYEAQK